MKLVRRVLLLLFLCMLGLQAFSQEKSSAREVGLFYFQEVVNKKKIALLDCVFTQTYIAHNLTSNSQEIRPIAEQRKFLLYLFKAFPDLKYTIGDIITENNKVVMRVAFSGTHTSEFLGHQPTGKRIDYLSELFFFRVEKNKIVESWVQIDWETLHKKLQVE